MRQFPFCFKPLPGNVYAICPHFYSFGIFGWMEDALSSHWVQLSQHAKWHDNSFMSSLSRSTIPFKKCFIRPLTCSNGFHIKVLREHDVIIEFYLSSARGGIVEIPIKLAQNKPEFWFQFCNFTVNFSVYIVCPSVLSQSILKLHKI